MIKFLIKKSCLLTLIISCYLIFSMFFKLWEYSLWNHQSFLSYHVLNVINTIMWTSLIFIAIVAVCSFAIRIEAAITDKTAVKQYFNKNNLWNLINSFAALSALIVIKMINTLNSNKINDNFSITFTQQWVVIIAASILLLMILTIIYLSFIYTSHERLDNDAHYVDFQVWLCFETKQTDKTNRKIERANQKLVFLAFIKKLHLICHILDVKAELQFKIRTKLFLLSILKTNLPIV